MNAKFITGALVCALAFGSLMSCQKPQEEQLPAPVPTVSACGDDYFTVVWEAVPDATTYNWECSNGTSGSTAECAVTVSGVSAGTYTVSVTASGAGYADSEAASVEATIYSADELAIEMSLSYVSKGTFDMNFTYSSAVSGIEYAVVSFFDDPEEVLAGLELGNVECEVADAASSVRVETGDIGPYMVYARGVTAGGQKSDFVYDQIMPSPGALRIESADIALMDYTIAVNDPSIAYVGTLVVSKEVLAEYGMTMEEITELYAEYGMVPAFGDGEAAYSALNGYANYEYYVGLAYFDKATSLVGVDYFSYTSGSVDNSLPLPEDLTITVSNIGSDRATTTYTPGANTRLYYQSVMSYEDYDSYMISGPELGYESGEAYLMAYVSFYGYVLIDTDVYTWTDLEPSTSYVALGYPVNANGEAGAGKFIVTEFTTAADGTASLSALPSAPAARRMAAKPVSSESLRELLKK